MLTIMCGFPGSGKSTYLSTVNFKEGSKEGTVILCPDDFRLELTGQQYHGPAEDTVWSNVKLTARVLLRRGYDIIIDDVHLTRPSRGSWIRIANEIGVAVDCLWQDVPPKTALSRNRKRPLGQIVPDDVMARMIGSFSEPTCREGFTCIHQIGTED
jgi:predicted kinase